MGIVIQPYTEEHVPEVRLFNQRLLEGGAPSDFQFPASSVPRWLPKLDGRRVYNEFFLAIDDAKAVRGTYVLKTQDFSIRGTVHTIGYYHHPFSEGIVNKTYARVGLQTLMNALRTQPLMYCLGMGGYDRPLPQMLIAMGWSHCLIPFYFKVIRAKAFLQNLQLLQSDNRKRLAANIAAVSGLGSFGINAYQRWKAMQAPRVTVPRYEPVPEFGSWAETVWQQSRGEYAMLAVRDLEAVQVLYPADNTRLYKLQVFLRNEPGGWAVVADTQMRDHPQYGNMRVGHIIDSLARPEDAGSVMTAATRFLADRGVDMIMSNQSHAAWITALESNGFLQGPSNFIFATSKKLTGILGPLEQTVTQVHINRGDGDGLYQYL